MFDNDPQVHDDTHTHTPSGPGGTWQVGDHYLHPGLGCVPLTAANAEVLNQHAAKIKIADQTRMDYSSHRPCPKCKCVFPAKTEYHPEHYECEAVHGSSEHFERECHNCGYIWAENIP